MRKQQKELNNSVGDYISDDKENSSEEINSGYENDMKRRLFENLKKAGVLDGMKSTLRGRLYEQLRLQNEKPKTQAERSNQLSFKIAVSLVADLMQKCDMPYALSVFLPESGQQQEVLSKSEVLEVLGLKNDEHYMAAAKHDMSPLLLDLVDVIKANKSLRPNKVSSYV